MKKGTLTDFFEKTGTYIDMTPIEKKIEQKKRDVKTKNYTKAKTK